MARNDWSDVCFEPLQVKDYTVLNPVNVEAIAEELAHQILSVIYQ